MSPTESPASQQETMFEEQTGFDAPYEEDASYEPVDEPSSAELPATEPSMAELPTAELIDEPEQHVEAEVEQTHAAEPTATSTNAALASEAEADPNAVLTVDDFVALEERVLRAVDLVRRERQARAIAEERVVALQTELAQLQAETPAVDLLRQEVESLRLEREQVRQRVERLLSQLDALEL